MHTFEPTVPQEFQANLGYIGRSCQREGGRERGRHTFMPQDTCVRMLIIAISIIAKSWKEPKYPAPAGCIVVQSYNRMLYCEGNEGAMGLLSQIVCLSKTVLIETGKNACSVSLLIELKTGRAHHTAGDSNTEVTLYREAESKF